MGETQAGFAGTSSRLARFLCLLTVSVFVTTATWSLWTSGPLVTTPWLQEPRPAVQVVVTNAASELPTVTPVFPNIATKSAAMTSPKTVVKVSRRDNASRTTLKPTRTVLILAWTKFFRSPDFGVGFGPKPFRTCRQRNCVFTNDRGLLQQADAVIFHGRDINMYDVPKTRSPGQRFIFNLLESPRHTFLPYSNLRNFFNLTMTYRQDSDVVWSYFRMEKGVQEKGVQEPPLPSDDDRKLPVLWIVSHCRTSSGREEYVQELSKHIRVDIYGNCGRRCPDAGSTNPDGCIKPLAPNYFFYLSMENSRCRDYITEKLSTALQFGLVPVVYGAQRDQYEAVVPADSFIYAEDFSSPRDLAEYLQYLMANRTAYREYFRWRDHYRVVEYSRASWCELCELLQRPDLGRKTYDLRDWWVKKASCRKLTEKR